MAKKIYVPDYLNKYIDPLMSYRFIVEIDGSAVGAFSQFSGIKMQVNAIQARSGNDIRGVQEYIPATTSFSPVTLTRGVFGENDFLNWLFSAGASRFVGPSGQNLYRTIDVIALDDSGSRGVIWTLLNAMPIGYEVSPMDSTRSEVLSESVTFAIQGVDRSTSEFSFQSA